MSYQVGAGDPIVSIDDEFGERPAALALKAGGVTSQAQLDAVIAGLTVGNNPGMSAAALTGLKVLLSIIRMTP